MIEYPKKKLFKKNAVVRIPPASCLEEDVIWSVCVFHRPEQVALIGCRSSKPCPDPVGRGSPEPAPLWLAQYTVPTDSRFLSSRSCLNNKKKEDCWSVCVFHRPAPKLPQSAVCRRNHALTRWVGVSRSQPHFGWLSIQSRQTSRYISSRACLKKKMPSWPVCVSQRSAPQYDRCLKKKMPSWPVCVSHRSAPQYARSLKKKMPRWAVCVSHRSAPQYARCPDRLSFGETMP